MALIRMPYRKAHIQSWFVLTLTLALGLAAGAFQLVRSRAAIEREQQDRLQTQAIVVTENIIRQLNGVASALTGLRADLQLSRKAPFRTEGPGLSLATVVSAMPGVVGIAIFDANGVVVASDKPGVIGRNYSERAYFQTPKRTNEAETLYISPPFRSSRGTYSVNLSRSVTGPDGEFLGVVTANLDPEYFGLVARSVLYAPDMVVNIAHGGGEIFVDARPGEKVEPNEIQSAYAMLVAQITLGQGDIHRGRFIDADGDDHLLVVRTIFPASLHMDFPLLVAVSRKVSDIYQPWYKEVRLYAISYSLLVVGATVAVLLMQLRQSAVLRAAAIQADHQKQTQIAESLQSANAELERLSVTDGLTGVGNRRMFEKALAAEWARCGRAGVPVSLLLVDVDHFKLFNDKYGHAVGDDVLVQVANALTKAAKRSGELAARFGGEEFVVLLPATGLEHAQAIADEVVRRVRAAKILHGGSLVSEYVSVSVGVASAIPGKEGAAEDLLKAADDAMYDAKRSGRNRIATSAQRIASDASGRVNQHT